MRKEGATNIVIRELQVCAPYNRLWLDFCFKMGVLDLILTPFVDIEVALVTANNFLFKKRHREKNLFCQKEIKSVHTFILELHYYKICS